MKWNKEFSLRGVGHLLILSVFLLAGCAPAGRSTPAATPDDEAYAEEREAMVANQIAARGVSDELVLAAMRAVPRHEFVPDEYLGQAYDDHPLPIGFGQTISQPYIVALMTELLQIEPGDSVLEVGTGSGYQAAVLAEITDQVYTVEIIPELASSAEESLRRLGYTQVIVANLDGYYGWEEYAPFDAIIVTAAPDHIPSALVQQLKDGGRLVIPVGPPGAYQTLWQIIKQGEQLVSYNWGPVRFVPLTGGPG
ncbi:MAG: protein-L-isoaspartate(D-aspartate) O-methyltransferase [Chloroflexi bacterium]|nr:protein-L-isoaspartate(D-aspartate) O-methyltransferase [Chloroflexota bacterium]